MPRGFVESTGNLPAPGELTTVSATGTCGDMLLEMSEAGERRAFFLASSSSCLAFSRIALIFSSV